MANVKEVEWKGGIYNIADEVARGESQQARALADTAQATAERALTAAGNAQNAAGAAQDTAEDAQITADTAKNIADDISTQFTNYKKLESAEIEFTQRGTIIFNKRGNICQISIRGRQVSPGKYTVQIPSGFAPLSGNSDPGFLLIWGKDINGYCSVSADSVAIYVDELANINAQQTFLM